jgi:hypothetical protein
VYLKLVAKFAVLVVLALIFNHLPAAQAQSTRGTVTGTITDPSGAVIPNAEVTLANPATGVAVKLHTNSAGIYRFEAVLAGEYNVVASAEGFQKSESGVSITVGATVGRNFVLKIGSATTVEVSEELPELQTSDSVRSAAISANQMATLPINSNNSLNLMLLIPGVVASKTGGGNDNGIGAVNGARGRSNNFMIDGINNNDISVTGPQYTISNTDLLQEVSVQASNFTSDFGHAGGAVVSQVTKSGTNTVHGTFSEIYRSQIFDASTQLQRYTWRNYSTAKQASTPVVPKYMDSMPGFTVGGPVVIPHLYDGRNKTFFFGGAQWDHYSNGANISTFSYVPTANGYATLAALSGSCTNVATYLGLLGPVRSTDTNPSLVSIAVPTALASSTCNKTARTGQSVEVGTYTRSMPDITTNNNHLIRIDHQISPKQNIMFRWIWSSTREQNSSVGINSDYDVPYTKGYWSGNVNHDYVISPNIVNEFRFGFSRSVFAWNTSNTTALSNPTWTIDNLTNLTLSASYPQGRYANTWQWSDTVTWTKGRHAFKFGADITRQLATQRAPINNRGAFVYKQSAKNGTIVPSVITSMANFIDDVAGPSGSYTKYFATGRYHPNLFLPSFYAEDTYKVTSDLTVNFGVRYENYGQPANIFKYAAYSGLYGNADDAVKAHQSNFNFGPSVGFAYNPEWLSHKTVIRGGYSITYDTFYNNLLSNIAAAAPNVMTNAPVTSSSSSDSPRGYVGLSNLYTTATANTVTPYTGVGNQFNRDIRNPYYNHFSIGIQQEMPGKVILDLAYVGTLGRQLFFSNNVNPILPDSTHTSYATQKTANYGTQYTRLNAARGSITSRESGVTSNYSGLQVAVSRRAINTVAGKIDASGNYTWSKNMDVLSDTFSTYSSGTYMSKSITQYGSAKGFDYGPSDMDRRHVANVVLHWQVRELPSHKLVNRVVGGWSLSPVLSVMSGSPFNVVNGTDRDLDGASSNDRPNIGNKNAPLNTRAVITTACASGYYNPNVSTTAANACVNASDVHWVQAGTYEPTSSSMESRNAVTMGRYLNLDLSVAKSIEIRERLKLQLRSEFYNVTNTQSYDVAKFATSVSSSANTFMDNKSVSGGARSFQLSGKIIF